jgi:NADPH2:quinone reductase
MRAIVVRELSGWTGVGLETVPRPAGSHRLTPGERMLIRVHAAGIAFPDVLMAQGALQFDTPLPFISGAEAAGVVLEAPPGSGFEPGDRVAGSVLGGGMADYALMRPAFTVKLPPAVSFVDGVALYLNYCTAWVALEKLGFRPGHRVLVTGAAGGVGTAALDILRARGGESTALVSSEVKAEVARGCGADHVLRSDEPWLAEARALSGGGVDLVLDLVGGGQFIDHLRALRNGGKLAVIGFAAGSIPEVKVNRLLLRNLSVIGFDLDVWEETEPGVANRAATEVMALAAAGRLHPVIGARFPLEQGHEAIRVLQERRALGKVVVDIATETTSTETGEQR